VEVMGRCSRRGRPGYIVRHSRWPISIGHVECPVSPLTCRLVWLLGIVVGTEALLLWLDAERGSIRTPYTRSSCDTGHGSNYKYQNESCRNR
jgi:hypothetical protein